MSFIDKVKALTAPTYAKMHIPVNERGLPMHPSYAETTEAAIDGADIAKMEGTEAVTYSMPVPPSPGAWVTVPTSTYTTSPATTAWPLTHNHADVLFKAMYKEMQVAVLEGADQATLVKLYSGYFSQIEAAIRMENDSKELTSKMKEIEAEADTKLAALTRSMMETKLRVAAGVISAGDTITYKAANRYSDMAGAGYIDPKGIYGTTTS